MTRSEYERAPTREQMEDIMGNRVNVMNGQSEVGTSRRQRRGEAATNQGSKQASKQSESVNLTGDKMEKDCSISRLEQGRTERQHLVICECS
jgi:hypothetical protein